MVPSVPPTMKTNGRCLTHEIKFKLVPDQPAFQLESNVVRSISVPALPWADEAPPVKPIWPLAVLYTNIQYPARANGPLAELVVLVKLSSPLADSAAVSTT